MSMSRNTSKALQHVLTCGNILSNIAFNMAQDQQVPESWRQHLKKRREDWDLALQAWQSAKQKDSRR